MEDFAAKPTGIGVSRQAHIRPERCLLEARVLIFVPAAGGQPFIQGRNALTVGLMPPLGRGCSAIYLGSFGGYKCYFSFCWFVFWVLWVGF